MELPKTLAKGFFAALTYLGPGAASTNVLKGVLGKADDVGLVAANIDDAGDVGKATSRVDDVAVGPRSVADDVAGTAANSVGVLVGNARGAYTFRPSGGGTQLYRTTRVGGQKLRVNSGQGYNRAHKSGDLRHRGLPMDDIDDAIVDDVMWFQKRGDSVPSVTGPGAQHVDRVLDVNGISVGYRLSQLPDGPLNVGTYWPI
jgi:hypothetical protein